MTTKSWTYDAEANAIEDANGYVCSFSIHTSQDWYEQASKIRLVAAAPDLLAFAKRVCYGEGDDIRTLIEHGKAVIAKATI